MDTHQYDKRWCVCNTLAFLKKADPEEMQFYEQYKPRGFVKAKQRMTEDIWRKVYHPNESRYISAILAAIWQGAASIRAMPHKQFGFGGTPGSSKLIRIDPRVEFDPENPFENQTLIRQDEVIDTVEDLVVVPRPLPRRRQHTLY